MTTLLDHLRMLCPRCRTPLPSDGVCPKCR